MVKSIATTPSSVTNNLDFKAIKEVSVNNNNGGNITGANRANKQRLVVVGTMMGCAQSPSDRWSLYMPSETRAFCQLGGAGPPGGSDGEYLEDDEYNAGDGHNGRASFFK